MGIDLLVNVAERIHSCLLVPSFCLTSVKRRTGSCFYLTNVSKPEVRPDSLELRGDES